MRFGYWCDLEKARATHVCVCVRVSQRVRPMCRGRWQPCAFFGFWPRSRSARLLWRRRRRRRGQRSLRCLGCLKRPQIIIIIFVFKKHRGVFGRPWLARRRASASAPARDPTTVYIEVRFVLSKVTTVRFQCGRFVRLCGEFSNVYSRFGLLRLSRTSHEF